MTSNSSVTKILPKVRKTVLQLRATRDYSGFGLSHIVHLVTGIHVTPGYVSRPDRNRYTSGAPKKYRGHVQRCLSILAKEGLVYERQRPEGYVAPYEHGETDKRFRIRITQDEAKKRLARMCH